MQRQRGEESTDGNRMNRGIALEAKTSISVTMKVVVETPIGLRTE